MFRNWTDDRTPRIRVRTGMADRTRGILDAINRAGTYTLSVNGQTFPKVQAITVAEMLQGKRQ